MTTPAKARARARLASIDAASSAQSDQSFFGRLDSAELRRLVAWLTLWVFLPNAGFALVWMIGSPPRYPDILATGVVGLLLRRSGPFTRSFAFVMMVLYAVIQFIARQFNLSLGTLVSAARFQTELQYSEAPTYIIAILLLSMVLIVGALVARRDMAFSTLTSTLIATTAISAVATVDYVVVLQSRGSYRREAPSDAAFESGVRRSGFLTARGDGRNLVLITVEALGVPRDPALAAQIFTSLKTDAITARYTVTQGSSLFYGSTTNAEVRELCGHWGNYDALLEKRQPSCLPFLLRHEHYQTTALHGFQPSFFDRALWYPNIGFQTMLFAAELIGKGAGTCPSLFSGACDRDIPKIIATRLKAAKGPQFIYWLTLNTHFPVPTLDALHTTDCEKVDAKLAAERPMVCRMVRLWGESFAALATEITAQDFPRTDILIVGDHRPPFYDRKQRETFEADRVPWVLLRAKK